MAPNHLDDDSDSDDEFDEKSHALAATAELWEAVRSNDIDNVESLLNNPYIDVNSKNQDGESLLYFSAKQGQGEIVRLLVINGANLNANSAGLSPIGIAAQQEQKDIVKALLDADDNIPGRVKQNEAGSRKTLEAIFNSRNRAIEKLIENSRDNDRGQTWASEFQNFDAYVKRISKFTSENDPNFSKLINVINNSYQLYAEGRNANECIQFLKVHSLGLLPERFGTNPLQFFDFNSTFYTQDRINSLVTLARSYENQRRISTDDPKITLTSIIDAHSKFVEDKVWFKKITADFEAEMHKGTSPFQWLSQKLKEYDIHLAHAEFQMREDKNTNEEVCMTFAYKFLKNSEDDYYSNGRYSVDERAKKLVGDECKPTSLENLKAGDIILYLDDSSECTHIALYVGKIDGTDYAVSKFGSTAPVFTHPIANQPEYGAPHFFTHTLELTTEIQAKLAKLQKSISNVHHVQDESLKLHSGSPTFRK